MSFRRSVWVWLESPQSVSWNVFVYTWPSFMITFEEENNEKCFNYSLPLGVSQSHTQTVWGVFCRFFRWKFWWPFLFALWTWHCGYFLFCDADRFHIENKMTNQDHEQIESIDTAIATVEWFRVYLGRWSRQTPYRILEVVDLYYSNVYIVNIS